MAKNVTVQGASYTAVPAVNLPLTGGGTARFTDTSEVTALASDVASGKTFVDANGILQTGTASGGGGALIVGISYDEQTEVASLNKTWQEIYDSMASGSGAVIVDEVEEEGYKAAWIITNAYIEMDTTPPSHMIRDTNAVEYLADSADGYPVSL